ncbi:far upstream element-binding protein 2-like isoform X1 [Cherax quadricarinatus]
MWVCTSAVQIIYRVIAAKQAADANAAAWAAYYSQYYGGQQNQNTPNSGPPTSQPQPNASQPPSGPQAGGQPDYSAQWADYYRSMGMHREAEAIEQQAKGMKVGGPGPNAAPQQGGGVQAATPGGGVGGGTGAQDYSQQWIEYYRSQGMHTEADKIEAQIKASKVTMWLCDQHCNNQQT